MCVRVRWRRGVHVSEMKEKRRVCKREWGEIREKRCVCETNR